MSAGDRDQSGNGNEAELGHPESCNETVEIAAERGEELLGAAIVAVERIAEQYGIDAEGEAYEHLFVHYGQGLVDGLLSKAEELEGDEAAGSLAQGIKYGLIENGVIDDDGLVEAELEAMGELLQSIDETTGVMLMHGVAQRAIAQVVQMVEDRAPVELEGVEGATKLDEVMAQGFTLALIVEGLTARIRDVPRIGPGVATALVKALALKERHKASEAADTAEGDWTELMQRLRERGRGRRGRA